MFNISNCYRIHFIYYTFLQLAVEKRRQINGLRGLLGLVVGRFIWLFLVDGLLCFSAVFFFEASYKNAVLFYRYNVIKDIG